MSTENRESEDLPSIHTFEVFGEKTTDYSGLRVELLLLLSLPNVPMKILLSFLFCLPLLLCGQPDSTGILLRPAEIKGTIYSEGGPFSVSQTLDTSALARLNALTLSDRLDRESPLFVKAYGPGSLSTISLRGTGAAHTALTWNGLYINSPMLGLYDFSLLPAWLLGDINLQSGGNGPLSGNGAIGGAIRINSAIPSRQGIAAELMTGLGSFGQYQYGGGFRYANGKVYTQTRIYSQTAENNFPFTGVEGESRIQQHAQFRQYGFTQDLAYGKESNRISIHAWALKNQREIPPHMLSSVSLQEQEDASYRLAAKWSVIHKKFFWHLRTGAQQEKIHYRDPAAELDEPSTVVSMQGEGDAGIQLLPQIRITGQLAWLQASATVESYHGTASQQQYSTAIKVLYDSKKIQSTLALRQAWFDGKAVPLLPSASIFIPITPKLGVRAEAGMIYRIPTLNDRFWQPGGNPDLDPEKGFSTTAGLTGNFSHKQWSFRYSAQAFLTQLNHALIWLPGTDGVYYAANIHAIESMGADASLETSVQLRKWKGSLRLMPVYTSSVITKSDASYSSGLNKQLVYTPRLLYKGQFSIQYRQFSLQYFHQYTGYRYVTVDHTQYLEPFDVAEVYLSWEGTLFKNGITISGGVKNIYDTNYQVIAWRAMPGRSFQARILFTFAK